MEFKYQRKLAFCCRVSSAMAEVEDVCRRLLSAYRALFVFVGDSAFYTWLYRIGINTAKNYLVSQGRRAPTRRSSIQRKRKHSRTPTTSGYQHPGKSPAVEAIGQTVNLCDGLLPRVVNSHRAARELEGMSYEEIVEIMKCSDRYGSFLYFVPGGCCGKTGGHCWIRHRDKRWWHVGRTDHHSWHVRSLDGTNALVEVEQGLGAVTKKGGMWRGNN